MLFLKCWSIIDSLLRKYLFRDQSNIYLASTLQIRWSLCSLSLMFIHISDVFICASHTNKLYKDVASINPNTIFPCKTTVCVDLAHQQRNIFNLTKITELQFCIITGEFALLHPPVCCLQEAHFQSVLPYITIWSNAENLDL